MTGPEHYLEAQRLLNVVAGGAADWEPMAAAAQVHATLALAAATALPAGDYEAWRSAAAGEVTR
jgi:hypothetical protein